MSTEMVNQLNRQSGASPLAVATEIQMALPPVEECNAPLTDIIVVEVPNLATIAAENTTAPLPEIVVVSPEAESTLPSTPESAAGESMARPHEERPSKSNVESVKLPPISIEKTCKESAELEAIANSMMEMMKQPEAPEQPVQPKPVAELQDAEWSRSEDSDQGRREQSRDRTTPEPTEWDIDSNSIIDQSAIEQLADKIVERFPKGVDCILGFISSETNSQLEQTCALVAQELARREQGHVLLLDADTQEMGLTAASNQQESRGFKNLITDSKTSLENSLITAKHLSLDFLPAGNVDVKYWLQAKRQTVDLFDRLKSAYRFVCVSLGDAHGRSAKTLGSCCTGAFLLVSLSNSSRIVVRSAAQQLHKSGTPLIGSIVTDVPTVRSRPSLNS